MGLRDWLWVEILLSPAGYGGTLRGDVYLIEEKCGCAVMSLMQQESTVIIILHDFIMGTRHAIDEKIGITVILHGVYQQQKTYKLKVKN